MRSSSGTINIAASAQRHDVNNQISLRFYYRIADNILKQADIFRQEKNILDLYIMLLRFSSLASETIPCHRDYRAASQSDKIFLKKTLLNAISELEALKPAVRQKLNELNRKHTYQINGWPQNHHRQSSSLDSSLEWAPTRKQNMIGNDMVKKPSPAPSAFLYQAPRTAPLLQSKLVEEQFHRLPLSMPCPREETRLRHCILGPNGLHGSWQPPSSIKGVQYPSNIDFTPVVIPRGNGLEEAVEDSVVTAIECNVSGCDRPSSETISPSENIKEMHNAEELSSLISFETDIPLQTEIIRQPSPPPVLAEVQDLICTTASSMTETGFGVENTSPDVLVCSESPLQLHISTKLMDSFMKLAKSNTTKNLETCGVLAGLLKNRKFYITALIIPKQESTSDSCQTTNEEEIFEVQDKQSLFPLGWIHTHPTQSCFMSSIDLHTHYSYQIMLPEAIAVVMAPRDSSRKHGIFRLTTPGGMTVIRQCPRRGFHAHDPPSDGGPLYRQCTDVYMDSNLKFDVIDLR